MSKRIFKTFFIGLFLVLWGSCSMAQQPVFAITVLYSNDFHGANMRLLAKRAAIVKQIRAQTDHPVLLVDEGDIFTRGRYAMRFFGELEFAVLNEMHYDAIVLGNNEFKATAQTVLADRIRQARFSVLCSNVIHEANHTYLPGVHPYIIKEFNGVKLGILGLTSTKINFYTQARGLHCLDPIDTAKTLVNDLAGKVDIVIALTHIGFDLDRVLAERTPGLSAIIGGDSHTILWKPLLINNIPIVQAGSNGHYLGRLDLSFGKNGSAWILRESSGMLIELDDGKIIHDLEVWKIIEDYLKRPLQSAA